MAIKIKRINVHNLKAVSNLTVDFNGCTAVITGGNNKGKTSFLRSTIERIQGTKPQMYLKIDEKDGFGEITMTDGCRFRWDFKEGGKEKLTYITEKDIKTSATRAICDKYFPATFDVDKFLTDQPQKQRKTLQDLAGLDFKDIDERYDTAFKERTAANTRAADAKTIYEAAVVPPKFEPVELAPLTEKRETVRTALNDQYLKNKQANDVTRNGYISALNTYNQNHMAWASEQLIRGNKIKNSKAAHEVLLLNGYDGPEVQSFINGLTKPEEKYSVQPPVEPKYPDELPDNKDLVAVDEEIEAAHEQNRKAKLYQDWLDLQTKQTSAVENAVKANDKVQAIEKERMDLIKSANMPEGFSFEGDGIAYNGLPFTREQLSSSGIYIAALKLASMKIGEVRSLHFDASFLDKKSLLEIEEWANKNDLQLLIERPDFEGGEIEYQILETTK